MGHESGIGASKDSGTVPVKLGFSLIANWKEAVGLANWKAVFGSGPSRRFFWR